MRLNKLNSESCSNTIGGKYLACKIDLSLDNFNVMDIFEIYFLKTLCNFARN